MDADDLVGRVIEAYGGAPRWTSARSTSGMVLLGGRLFQLKRVRLPPSMEITTLLDRPHARLDPIDDAGHVGVLEGPHVRLETTDGVVVERRDDVRDSLTGPGSNSRWDALDLTYFLGCAFWGYHGLVRWLLRADVEKRLIGPCALELTLPEGTPAHCRTQRFSFDSGSALLERNDYHPEVAAGNSGLWVANQVRRHDRWEGIPYPSRRRVTPTAGGRPMPFPTFVSIDVSDWRLLD